MTFEDQSEDLQDDLFDPVIAVDYASKNLEGVRDSARALAQASSVSLADLDMCFTF